MVTLINVVRNIFEPVELLKMGHKTVGVVVRRLPEEKVSVNIRFVRSSVGVLPQEAGVEFVPWYFHIKAMREDLTQKLQEQK